MLEPLFSFFICFPKHLFRLLRGNVLHLCSCLDEVGLEKGYKCGSTVNCCRFFDSEKVWTKPVKACPNHNLPVLSEGRPSNVATLNSSSLIVCPRAFCCPVQCDKRGQAASLSAAICKRTGESLLYLKRPSLLTFLSWLQPA
jgi:hypothetical protein